MNLKLVPVFADGTSVIDANHVIPAEVNFPAGVHWTDPEGTELAPGATPDEVVFTPDAGGPDTVSATVDGWTQPIDDFKYTPPSPLTGFKIEQEA